MSLKKNESDIEHIAYSDRKVYSVLSDLRNLKKLESNFEDEEKRRTVPPSPSDGGFFLCKQKE